jgi:hypothetical protein
LAAAMKSGLGAFSALDFIFGVDRIINSWEGEILDFYIFYLRRGLCSCTSIPLLSSPLSAHLGSEGPVVNSRIALMYVRQEMSFSA